MPDFELTTFFTYCNHVKRNVGFIDNGVKIATARLHHKAVLQLALTITFSTLDYLVSFGIHFIVYFIKIVIAFHYVAYLLNPIIEESYKLIAIIGAPGCWKITTLDHPDNNNHADPRFNSCHRHTRPEQFSILIDQLGIHWILIRLYGNTENTKSFPQSQHELQYRSLS